MNGEDAEGKRERTTMHKTVMAAVLGLGLAASQALACGSDVDLPNAVKCALNLPGCDGQPSQAPAPQQVAVGNRCQTVIGICGPGPVFNPINTPCSCFNNWTGALEPGKVI